MLPHKKAKPNPKRFNLLTSFQDHLNLTNSSQQSNTNWIKQNIGSKLDGLSDAQYGVISITKKKLYTHILSDF